MPVRPNRKSRVALLRDMSSSTSGRIATGSSHVLAGAALWRTNAPQESNLRASAMPTPFLLAAQGSHRVEPRGTPSRNEACSNSDRQGYCDHSQKHRRSVRACAIEHGADQLRGRDTASDSQCEAEKSW